MSATFFQFLISKPTILTIWTFFHIIIQFLNFELIFTYESIVKSV